MITYNNKNDHDNNYDSNDNNGYYNDDDNDTNGNNHDHDTCELCTQREKLPNIQERAIVSYKMPTLLQ